MYRLTVGKQRQVLNMLVEGSSMRSIERVVGVSIVTVGRLLEEAGAACLAYHDETVRDVATARVQADEIWSFCYAKDKNVSKAKSPPEGAGDVWTWTALAEESRLILAWAVSPSRSIPYALEFMDDLASRVANRIQLTTDGLQAYVTAVDMAFGGEVDYAQVVKEYNGAEEFIGVKKEVIAGKPDLRAASTSYMERHNLTTRMQLKRFTRETNAFSKRIERHCHALALYFTWYNFVRPHSSLGRSLVTPAMAAGLAERPHDFDWLVGLMEAGRPPAGPRGPYRRRVD